MKIIKYFIIGVFTILVCSCKDTENSIKYFYGTKYFKDRITSSIKRTAVVTCEDMSNNDIIKKKYIIEGFLSSERVYILWKKKDERKVFIELNKNRQYYLNQNESNVIDLSFYGSSILRYYLDSQYVGKTWITSEDTWSANYFSEENSVAGINRIYVTLLQVTQLGLDTLYYYRHSYYRDDENFEYFLIDQSLNLLEFSLKERDFKVRFTPEE